MTDPTPGSSEPADPDATTPGAERAESGPGTGPRAEADAESGPRAEPEVVGTESRKQKEKKERSFWKELPILVVVALLLSFVLQTFVARVYLIPSESMEPTLHGCAGCTGDRIVVEKLTFRFRDAHPGDVVVFRGPDSWSRDGATSNRSSNPIIRGFQELGSAVGLVAPDENDLVKRVIATAGQTVECCDLQGRVTVDGKPLDEPYVQMDFPWVPGGENATYPMGRVFGPITVPADSVWVMGDNRSSSADSRYHVLDENSGAVPLDNIIGKARWIVLPFSRIGSISDHDPQGS